MKIAISQPRVSYYVGGSEVVALKQAEALCLLGHEVTIFTSKPTNNEEYSPVFNRCKRISVPGLKIVEIEIPESYAFIYGEEPESSQIRWDRESILFSILSWKYVRELKPELLLTYYIVDAAYRHLDVPNVVYLGGYPPNEIELYNAFLTFCDGVICNSKHVEKHWRSKFLRNNINKICILPKGVDDLTTQAHPLPGDKRHIVFAGRLLPEKGVNILIDAFAKLTRDVNDLHLWILGDGKEMGSYKKQVEELAITKSVTFTGIVSDVQDYFKDATICVFPSMGREGLMTVVAEAMITGACVVTSKDIGNEELIENNRNGVLINPGDSKLLYRTMNYLLNNDELRKNISSNARDYAVSNLSSENMGKTLEKFLGEVISSGKN